MKMKVFLFAYNPKKNKELNKEAESVGIPTIEEYESHHLEFARIPTIGEHIALTSHDPRFFKVVLVVHTPFEDSECDAEVYAIAENANDVKDKSEYGEFLS